MRINDLIATECSDILRWKVPYNFEEEYYQIASALVLERATRNKAVLICMCLSKFSHLLLEQQEFRQLDFRSGVQKEAHNRAMRNFWFLSSSRLIGSLQDNFFKVFNKYGNWELTSVNTFLFTRTKSSFYDRYCR